MIFIHWASLEHEVFMQTLKTFVTGGEEIHSLPKEMNNIQFTAVLDLWKERVADKAPKRKTKALQRQYDAILALKDARDALAHGMWHWSAEDLGRISTVRVKKREVITSHFSAQALADIASQLGAINFKIRFPGGIRDLAMAYMEQGGHISRKAMAMFTAAAVGLDGYPTAAPKTKRRRSARTDG
ncbi:MAG: hypothetical protein KA538_07450 [Azonexus sp.]|nr:hypothetical protein [Azonexus sp.]